MTVKDIINLYCIQHHTTKAALAQKLGVTKERLHTALTRNDGMNMRVATLVEWLDKMDFEIEIVPLNGGEDFVLDGEDDSFWYEDS